MGVENEATGDKKLNESPDSNKKAILSMIVF